MNNETTLLVVFVGITGFALLVQAIVMLVAFLTMRKTIVSLQSDVQELRTTAMPILDKTRKPWIKSLRKSNQLPLTWQMLRVD